MLTPIFALIVWTLIIWIWLYATRIPAMQKAKVNPQDYIQAKNASSLPINVAVVADNYNHLHEQPTIFYALAFYTQLAGTTDGIAIGLAWAYVALRIAHSFAQIVVQKVMLRFAIFSLATVMLFVLALKNLLALVA